MAVKTGYKGFRKTEALFIGLIILLSGAVTVQMLWAADSIIEIKFRGFYLDPDTEFYGFNASSGGFEFIKMGDISNYSVSFMIMLLDRSTTLYMLEPYQKLQWLYESSLFTELIREFDTKGHSLIRTFLIGHNITVFNITSYKMRVPRGLYLFAVFMDFTNNPNVFRWPYADVFFSFSALGIPDKPYYELETGYKKTVIEIRGLDFNYTCYHEEYMPFEAKQEAGDPIDFEDLPKSYPWVINMSVYHVWSADIFNVNIK